MPRTRVYSTEAIALKRMDFGEADRLLTVLTPHFGKLRLLAKGVRRPTSRMGGHLETFAHVHLMVAKGRDLDLVTQATVVEPFRELRDDLVRSSYAYHLGELVDGFLEDRDENSAVFNLLRQALRALAEGTVPPDLIARHFELHLLDEAGFRPSLTSCLACSAAIRPGPNQYSTTMGGVYCPQCGRHEVSAVPIAVDTLKLLRYLQRTVAVDEVTVRPPELTKKDAERLLRRQVEHGLERRLRAVEFVRRVAEETASYRS